MAEKTVSPAVLLLASSLSGVMHDYLDVNGAHAIALSSSPPGAVLLLS